MEKRSTRGLSVAILVVLVLLMAARLFMGGGRDATVRPAAEAPAPHAEPAAELRAEPAPETRTERAPETVLDAKAENTVPSAPPADSARVVVRARLVDERRAPLAHGRLTMHKRDGETSASGADDGQVALELARDHLLDGPSGSFVASARDRATRWLNVDVGLFRSAPEVDLGEIVLAAAGTLVGRVIDDSGAPIAGAQVVACPPGAGGDTRVWLPFSSFPDGSRAFVTSGEGGVFRLEGVPCGAIELFASDDLHLVGRAGPIELGVGERNLGDVVLPAASDAERIAGSVRAQDGAPFEGAMIRLLDEREQSIYGSQKRSDAAGRFALLAGPDRTYTLVAYDPSNMRPTRAKGVHAGDLAVELRFVSRGSLDVTAHDERGPVAAFRVVVQAVDRRSLAWSASDALARARVDVPDETFRVLVMGPEHVPLQLGPFEPTAAPAQLEAALVLAGGIGGVVLADGAPVANAEVHAHTAVEGAEIGWMQDGFASRVATSSVSITRSDASGRFFLRLRSGGRIRVHASAAGRARAVSSWFDLREGERVEDCEFRLPRAGAIEGRVRVAAGVEARGRWIGAGDGEGHVELAQTDADGAFTFPALAPGSWQVRRVHAGNERELTHENARVAGRESVPPPVFDVVVRAGETTRVDLDLTGEVTCTLEGRLTLGSAPPSGWTVSLGRSDAQPLDADGRFTARSDRSGENWLGFQGDRATLSLPLDLRPGANAWELDLPVGEVRLDNLPRPPAREPGAFAGPDFWLEWRAAKVNWSAWLPEDPSASLRFERVPAGHLVLRSRDVVHADEPSSWPVLTELDLAAGEVRTVRLP